MRDLRKPSPNKNIFKIAHVLNGYINGSVPTRYREASELYDIRIIMPES